MAAACRLWQGEEIEVINLLTFGRVPQGLETTYAKPNH